MVRTQLDDYKATEREREKKRMRAARERPKAAPARVAAGGGLQKAWEPEEDNIIQEMHERMGPKWKQIVKELPGRTISSVKNRWQRIEKGRRLREEGAELKNRCHACGQPKKGHICPGQKERADSLFVSE